MDISRKDPVLTFVFDYLTCLHLQYLLADGSDTNMSALDLGLRRTILKRDGKPPAKIIRHIEDNTVYQILDYYNCNYSFMKFTGETKFLFVGPYLLEPVLEPDIYSLMELLQIPGELFSQLRDYYASLPCILDKTSVSMLLLQLCRTLSGADDALIRHIDLKDLETQDEYLKQHQFQIPEDPILSMHLQEKRYQYEDDLLAAIAQGNTAKALSITESIRNARFPPRSGDVMRDSKNFMISFNTLMRRTAYSSGVHPFYINAVSGNYVRMIEQARSRSEISDIISYIVQSYCHLVKKRSMSSYSEPVRQILVTVDASLSADLSLRRFAEELFLNTSYLSALFKKEVGLTLTDYVNKSRIAYAKKLLKSTALSIQDIATQSGIPDIHYFTRLFRRETSLSPREWRNQ